MSMIPLHYPIRLGYNRPMILFWASLLISIITMACTTEPAPPASQPTQTPTATATATPTPTPQSSATATAIPNPSQTATSTPTAPPAPTATQTPQNGAQPLREMDVEQAFPSISFEGMVAMAFSDDGSNRAFLALQPGRIMVFPNEQDAESAAAFLDIRERVNDEGREEGLLGLAFDPNYRENGYFYVYYSASNPRRSVISRFSVREDNPNIADPDSEFVILEVAQPFPNHNGGQTIFGPDGLLYISLGDGGSGGDPRGNGQNPMTLLGSIIRIDVSTLDALGRYSIPPDNPFAGRDDGVREEIWAYGLRNPWRFTFDRETGEMWAADVGQNLLEEIDLIKPGLNYGWNIMEGDRCFRSSECAQNGLEPPVIVYGRGSGCSVTGGYVYRGARLPSLDGAYLYGDFCSGRIWGLRYDGSRVTNHLELLDSRLTISSFAEDLEGEVYILSFDRKIYRLTER